MNALILCAGRANRWRRHNNLPKQLARINHETLLGRSVRLLKQQNIGDITIIACDKQLHQPGCQFFMPTQYNSITETLLATQSLWQEKTLILLGDVFFSVQAMQTILCYQKSMAFFGRDGESWYADISYGEIYALAFKQNFHNVLINALKTVIDDTIKNHGRGKLWELYRCLSGFDLNSHQTDENFFVKIDDHTTDFDYYESYLYLREKYEYLARNEYFKSWVFTKNPVIQIKSVEFC